MKFEPVGSVVNKYMSDLKADLDSDLIEQKSEGEPKITEIGSDYKPTMFEDRKIKS